MALLASTTDITFNYNLTTSVTNIALGLSGMDNQGQLRLIDVKLLKETGDDFTMRITMFSNAGGGALNLFMDMTLRTVPSIPLGGSQLLINENRFIDPFCFNIPITTQETQTKYFVAEFFTS